MSFTKLASIAAVVGALGFAGKADAQVIYSGGTYYQTSPSVVYSSPSVVYPATYSYPTYSYPTYSYPSSSGAVYSSSYSSPSMVVPAGYTHPSFYNASGYSSTSFSTGPYFPSNAGYYSFGTNAAVPYIHSFNGYNNLYGNASGTGLNIGTRGATYNGWRLGRWR